MDSFSIRDAELDIYSYDRDTLDDIKDLNNLDQFTDSNIAKDLIDLEDSSLEQDLDLSDILPAFGQLVSNCENNGDNSMIGVSFPDGNCYLIDKYSVTVTEYYNEINNNGNLISDSEYCRDVIPGDGPRTSEARESAPPFISQDCVDHFFNGAFRWPPLENDINAMTCVNWCDANAYCKRVNKRLCKNYSIDQQNIENYLNPNYDEMYNAMTASGLFVYEEGQHPCQLDLRNCRGPYRDFFVRANSYLENPYFLAQLSKASIIPIDIEPFDYYFGIEFRCCADYDQ